MIIRLFNDYLRIILDYLRIFDNPLSKIFFRKEFLERIGYISSYLPKLNCALELISGESFLHIFFNENFPYIILHQLIKFLYETFSISQDLKQVVFLNSSLNT